MSNVSITRQVNITKYSYMYQKQKNNMMLYMLIFPSVIFVFVFSYLPITGLLAAFQNYDIFKGYFGSPWTKNFGLRHILDLFAVPELYNSILNTLYLSILNIGVTFPAAIILALLFNELRVGKFKKTVQTISYMPYFLSWISVIGLTISFFDRYGPFNDIMNLIFGHNRERILYLSKQELFIPFLLILNLWKNAGWNSIIYLASMAGIDPQLYEAASMDGARRFKQMLYITLPGIAPTATIIMILSLGGLLSSNFELVFGLQNPFINFEVIDTVVYKNGLVQADYSVATALGFTRGMIALFLTFGANYLSKKVNDQSIF
jgi:putative aldouronate transport system permease protein